VAISSPSRFALMKQVGEELDLDSIVGAFFQNEDLVFTEGYKGAGKAKIEICRRERGLEPLCSKADGLVALASDFPLDLGVPCFDLDDMGAIADFLEERFLGSISRPNLVLRLDGRKLPIKSFVREFLMGGILGMVATLRGYGDPSQVDISIRLKRPEK
jgi:molybdopterin-guanine dinucleotide biosynthesis protein B